MLVPLPKQTRNPNLEEASSCLVQGILALQGTARPFPLLPLPLDHAPAVAPHPSHASTMSPYANAAADVDSSTCTNNSTPPATVTDKLSSGIEVSCPSCGHQFRHHHQEEKQESMRLLPGLPAGVRFDPNDAELLEHLEGKTRSDGEGRSHPLIDEFIPTLQGENGICCTHPEKLPGIKTNGEISHFFHRPSKAYTTGTRKRRKVESGDGGETRWHKTGKTRPILIDGVVRGQKKILVLYSNFGKQRKPEKTSWVMHQYHLGSHDDEKDGELVVSKVFYQTQPRQPASSLKDSKSMISSGLREGCHSSPDVYYEGGVAAQLRPEY